MTEVEKATRALRKAEQNQAVALQTLQAAQRDHQQCLDATRAAWVALRDAQWQAGREGDTPTMPPPTTRGKPYNLMADIDRLTSKAKRKEEKNDE